MPEIQRQLANIININYVHVAQSHDKGYAESIIVIQNSEIFLIGGEGKERGDISTSAELLPYKRI